MADTAFEGWAVLELMGHRQRFGFVREVELAGGKMIRIDIPVNATDHITEYYGCPALYAIRPATEEIVRAEMKRYGDDPRPVRPLEYRERETPRIAAVRRDDDDAGSDGSDGL